MTAAEVVPLGPNVFAVCVCFAFLMAAPWICLEIQAKFWEDTIDEDPIANRFLATSVEESLVIAVVGSLLFLVIGVILQAWQSHRPFPSRWPLIFACPIAWVLLVPDALLRGGSVLSGVIVGTVAALAFGVYWVTLVYLRETME